MLMAKIETTMIVKQLRPWNSPTTSAKPSSHVTIPREKSHAVSKKSKRVRTAFTTSQLLALEAQYKEQKYISREARGEIALRFGIGDKQIKVWFQNRRMKEKKAGIESERSPSVPNSSFTDSGVSDLSDIDALVTEHNFSESPNVADHQTDAYMLPDMPMTSQDQNIHKNDQYLEPVNSGMMGFNEWNSGCYTSSPPAAGNQSAYVDGYYQPAPYMTAYGYTCGYNEMEQPLLNANYGYQNTPHTYSDSWEYITY